MSAGHRRGQSGASRSAPRRRGIRMSSPRRNAGPARHRAPSRPAARRGHVFEACRRWEPDRQAHLARRSDGKDLPPRPARVRDRKLTTSAREVHSLRKIYIGFYRSVKVTRSLPGAKSPKDGHSRDRANISAAATAPAHRRSHQALSAPGSGLTAGNCAQSVDGMLLR